MFNSVQENPNMCENVITLLTKHYIYKSWCLKEKILISGINAYFTMYKNIEQQIAINNDTHAKHENKWEKFKIA